jgi:hypothetical protein
MPCDRPALSALALLVAGGLVAVSSCTGGKTSTPTERLPGAASLIPSAPAPQPTPTPVPTPTPAEEPIPATPGGGGGGGSDVSGACGAPAPPPLSRINVKVHAELTGRAVLDATPLVGPDAAYCRLVGFTDGRSFCAVRSEGTADRQACEAALVGRAEDTGRSGPTWSANGKPCDGPDGGTSCLNHPDNQYLAFAYGSGTFRACAESGVCGEIKRP